MDSPLVLALAAWLALNALILLVGTAVVRRQRAWRDHRRRDPRSSIHSVLGAPPRDVDARIEGYGGMLLHRLLGHGARALGAERACLLVGHETQRSRLTRVAAHGLPSEAIGERVTVDTPGRLPSRGDAAVVDQSWVYSLVGSPLCAAVRVETVSGPQVVVCTGTSDADWGKHSGRLLLLGEMADFCAKALDDVSAGQLDWKMTVWQRALEVKIEHDRNSGLPAPSGVGALATRVGRRLSLAPTDQLELELAVVGYDAANIFVSRRRRFARSNVPAVLGLRGSDSAEFLLRIPGFEVAAFATMLLEERWDGGGGYGLVGEQIPIATRILAACRAVACAVDDTTAGNAAIERALSSCHADSGTVLDPTVAAALTAELVDNPRTAVPHRSSRWVRSPRSRPAEGPA